jgi:flagella basal body P-ring formation protein FlgA
MKKLLFLPIFLFAGIKEEIINFYKNKYPNIQIQKITSHPSLPKQYKKIKFLINPKMPYGNILIDGKYYYIKIFAKIPVYKSTQIIKQNSLILENINAKKELISFKYFYSKPISKISKDLIASKIISKNSILTLSNTKIAPAVLRGEKVNVIIKSKNINISTTAKALQDGNIGDKINIQMNRKIFNAKIIKKGMVEIE